jgi:hypothetical protein
MIVLSNFVCLSAGAVSTSYDRINITTVGVGTPLRYAIPNDGIDDTPQIQAAINGGGNKSIYFPPGTYNFKGLMNLGTNRSIRLYGDGPGVSTIIFKTDGSNPTAGINATDMGMNNLNVEGLTLQTDPSSNPDGCGTAINASFASNVGKFHTATIHNVQILGSSRDGTSGTYWNTGIHLYRASNAIVDKVEISGRQEYTSTGILWDAPTGQFAEATGFQLSNLEIKWCNIAFLTGGHVEGLYMTGFEIFSCGRAGLPAMALYGQPTGGTVHLVNGRVDSVGSGVKLENQFMIKVSNVSFNHSGPNTAGTMLWINYLNPPPGLDYDAMVTECSFYGVDNINTPEHGIFLTNAHSVRLAGNNFKHMLGDGHCIVVYGSSSVVRITDNLFSDYRSQYFDGNPDPYDPYFQGNNPPP